MDVRNLIADHSLVVRLAHMIKSQLILDVLVVQLLTIAIHGPLGVLNVLMLSVRVLVCLSLVKRSIEVVVIILLLVGFEVLIHRSIECLMSRVLGVVAVCAVSIRSNGLVSCILGEDWAS